MADQAQAFNWTLDTLEDIVQRDPAAGGEAALERLLENVQAVTERITEGIDKRLRQIKADADTQAAELKAEADNAIKDVTANARKAANNLIRDVDGGQNARDAALTAEKIIKEAEGSTININRRVEGSILMINERSASAILKFQETAKATLEELASAKEQAVAKISRSIKEIVMAHSPSASEGSQPDAAPVGAHRDATRSILAISQAFESMRAATEKAEARIQKAAEEAVAALRTVTTNGVDSVHAAVDQANEWILELTSLAVSDAVGEKKGEFYDLKSIKKKWVTRNG